MMGNINFHKIKGRVEKKNLKIKDKNKNFSKQKKTSSPEIF